MGHVRLQATKSEAEHARASSHLQAGPAGEESDVLEAQRRAAMDAATVGDGVGTSGRFKDSDFFIPTAQSGRQFEEGLSVRGGTASVMDDAVMDLLADDQVRTHSKLIHADASLIQCYTPAELSMYHTMGTEAEGIGGFESLHAMLQEGMVEQRRNFHWDKRKKQYVQLQPGEKLRAGKRMRTESGASVLSKNEPSGIYQKWSRAHQTKIAPTGQLEDAKAGNGAGLADRSVLFECAQFFEVDQGISVMYREGFAYWSCRFKKGGRGWKNPAKVQSATSGQGAGVREELKAPDQVRPLILDSQSEMQCCSIADK